MNESFGYNSSYTTSETDTGIKRRDLMSHAAWNMLNFTLTTADATTIGTLTTSHHYT